MKGMSIKIARLAVLLACSAVALAGCGKKSDQPAAKGQVVARVGEEVVTIQDLENEFRWANVTPDKQKEPEIVKRVLGELVVRKYLLRQAMAAKLDREPGVLLDLLRSREQILENAYLQRTAAAKAPGKLDVDRYIANNPAKFAGRKLLSVEQIAFPIGPTTQSFVEANKDAKSLDEIDAEAYRSRHPPRPANGRAEQRRSPTGVLRFDRGQEGGRRVLRSRRPERNVLQGQGRGAAPARRRGRGQSGAAIDARGCGQGRTGDCVLLGEYRSEI